MRPSLLLATCAVAPVSTLVRPLVSKSADQRRKDAVRAPVYGIRSAMVATPASSSAAGSRRANGCSSAVSPSGLAIT